jgi:hypothetical protein
MSESTAFTPLSERFDRALRFASDLHRHQARKQSPVTYVSHLMAVCAMVLEHGGDENQAIAALLHDGPEDQGGEPTLRRIREEFGDDVAALVAECSEPLHETKAPWRERKLAYLGHLASISPRAALIAGCDKLHNTRSLLLALATEGDVAFERFNGRARGTRWWHGQLAVKLAPRLPQALHDELVRSAGQIERFPTRAIHARGDLVRIQTTPLRYWTHAEIGHADRVLDEWRGRARVHLDGAGPMFLYTYLAARAAAHGVGVLSITQPGATHFEIRAEAPPSDSEGLRRMEVLRCRENCVLIRPDRIGPGQDDRFRAYERVAHAAARCIRPGDEVVLTGAMPMALAAAVAFACVARGASSLSCATPLDGMSRVHVFGAGLGTVSPMPEWLSEVLVPSRHARTFGVIGFPNSGKSVFSKALERSLVGSGVGSWVFEADPASPTPHWYFDLSRRAQQVADGLRDAQKVEWSDELQHEVARRLANARPWFDRVVVDLPGGDMKNPAGPQPIPAGREPLFREVDRFIIVRRPDRNDDAGVWLEALARHGLADRVHAIVDSIDVVGDICLELDHAAAPEGWLVGRAHGLRRDADLDALRNDEARASKLRLLLGVDA